MDKNIQAIKRQRELDKFQIAEQAENILEIDKNTYEKKLALFNLFIKEIEVGESQALKEQKINYLLESKLHSKLAKKALEEYRKTTVKAFSKARIR